MSGLQPHTIRIGAYDYQFYLLTVEEGHPLRWELIGVLGEPLLHAVSGMAAGKNVGDLDVDKVLAGLSGLFAKLDPAFVLRLQRQFIRKTQYRGQGGQWTDLEAAWQLHFAGKYHELDALTWAHLRANYLGFLDDSDVWQALRRAGQQALSAARSPTTSSTTGTSGGSSVATGSAAA